MIFRKRAASQNTPPKPEKLAAIKALHEEIDHAATTISTHLGEQLTCRNGCHDCCVDDITVFVIEADRIRNDFSSLLKNEFPHKAGKCAFLSDAGSCRIYAARPYVCRTQGLPLRWQEATGESGVEKDVEYRDICPLNDNGPALETLAEIDCWQIGPVEEKLRGLQATGYNDPYQRVLLRSLFTRNG